MRIVELQYMAPRILNYVVPVKGDEEPEEIDKSKREDPRKDQSGYPGQGQPGGAGKEPPSKQGS